MVDTVGHGAEVQQAPGWWQKNVLAAFGHGGFLPIIIVLGMRSHLTVAKPHRFEVVPGKVPMNRCPSCASVGTFRRYPEITREDATRLTGHDVGGAPERWLCKWCGWWWSEGVGVRSCCPDGKDGVWMTRDSATDPLPTPLERYLAHDPTWRDHLQLTV